MTEVDCNNPIFDMPSCLTNKKLRCCAFSKAIKWKGELFMTDFFETNYGKWIRAAVIRAVKTFFQVFASLITADGVSASLSDVDWLHIISVAAVALIYSLATSLANLPEQGSFGMDGGRN